jgi:hypothetical protein
LKDSTKITAEIVTTSNNREVHANKVMRENCNGGTEILQSLEFFIQEEPMHSHMITILQQQHI